MNTNIRMNRKERRAARVTGALVISRPLSTGRVTSVPVELEAQKQSG